MWLLFDVAEVDVAVVAVVVVVVFVVVGVVGAVAAVVAAVVVVAATVVVVVVVAVVVVVVGGGCWQRLFVVGCWLVAVYWLFVLLFVCCVPRVVSVCVCVRFARLVGWLVV